MHEAIITFVSTEDQDDITIPVTALYRFDLDSVKDFSKLLEFAKELAVASEQLFGVPAEDK